MPDFHREFLAYLLATLLLALLFASTQWALLVSIERGDLQSAASYGVKVKSFTGAKPELKSMDIQVKDLILQARWGTNLLLLLLGFILLSGIVRTPEPALVTRAKVSPSPGLVERVLSWWPEPNPSLSPILLPVLYLLTGLSLVTLFRLCPALVATKPISQNAVYLTMFQRQVYFVLAGIAAAALVYIILSQPRWLLRLKTLNWWIPALLNVILIVITIKFGVTINYRRLWIRVGSMNVQTIELGKIFMLIFLVNYFYRVRLFGWIIGWARDKHRRRLYWWLKHQSLAFVFYAVGLFPIVYQRDFGPILLFAFLYIALSYAWSCEFWTPLFLIVVFLIIGVGFYHVGWPSILVTRVELLKDPWSSVVGRVDSSQLANALWAFGASGFDGVGLGVGLPHRVQGVYAEFILAAIAEETGIIGALLVIGLYGWMLYGIYTTARNAGSYESFLGIGIMLMLGFQTLIIFGGITGTIFLTGITIPFLSYGGSSVVSSFVLIGMVLALRQRRRG